MSKKQQTGKTCEGREDSESGDKVLVVAVLIVDASFFEGLVILNKQYVKDE